MSETALRSVNAVLPSERRSVGKKQQQQGAMKVVVSGANDENQECARAGKSRRPLREPTAVVAKQREQQQQQQKVHQIAPQQTEAVAEPLVQDIEYILSEDLMPLQDADGQLSVRYLVLASHCFCILSFSRELRSGACCPSIPSPV